MIGFKVFSNSAGPHTRANIFVSQDGDNYAFAGQLCLREREYAALVNALVTVHELKILQFAEIRVLSKKAWDQQISQLHAPVK